MATLPSPDSRLSLADRWALRRQDRRSALLARRYGVLGVLMAAERVHDVIAPASRPDATARGALDVLWRTLHGQDRGAAQWNPAMRHVRQADDLQRWDRAVLEGDVGALLRTARRLAVGELDDARAIRATPRRALVAAASR